MVVRSYTLLAPVAPFRPLARQDITGLALGYSRGMRGLDYVDPRFRTAVDKAVEVLLSHRGEWSNEVEAYWLLVKHEDEIGVPVIYEIVREAVERARTLMAREAREAVKAEA